MGLTLEDMNLDELRVVVRRGGVMPSEQFLAGIRLERLEIEAVKIRGAYSMVDALVDGGVLSGQELLMNKMKRLELLDQAQAVMNEIRALTEEYFNGTGTDGHGRARTMDEHGLEA